jgi:hypothetical protein
MNLSGFSRPATGGVPDGRRLENADFLFRISLIAPASIARHNAAMDKTLRLVLIVVLILLLIGSLPAWPYSAGWGYYPSGGLGLVLLILLILLLLGRL